MNNSFIDILIIFLLLLLNGALAMAEIATVSARKIRLLQHADDGDSSAQVALELADKPNTFLSTVQIGITLIGTLAGAFGGATLAERLAVPLSKIEFVGESAAGLALAIVVLLTTYFSLVIGELIPKRLAMNNPEKVAMVMAKPMRFLSRVTSPIVKLLSASTELGLRLLGAVPSEEPPVTEEEIRDLMEQGTQVGVFEEAEQDMVNGIFNLGDRYVNAIMTPRTEIEYIDLDEPLDVLINEIRISHHTRFPAAHGSLDNVQGILQAKDLLNLPPNAQINDLIEMLDPPLFVPDSMSPLDVLETVKQSGVHVALVIDEYGGLLGMVTLYDILTTIVGAIPTLGEEEEPQIRRREDGSWILDGLLSVDEFKEALSLEELPEEDRVGYQTLGGFIFNQLGMIPSEGMNFTLNQYRFEVLDMDGRRVDKVMVNLIPEESEKPDKAA